MNQLNGKHLLIFVGNDYEDLELWYPKLRLVEAGAGVTVAGPEGGKVYRGKHGYPCVSDAAWMPRPDFGKWTVTSAAASRRCPAAPRSGSTS